MLDYKTREAEERRSPNARFLIDWTEERIATLKKMWGEGRTASDIALAVGGGATKNAVIGKVHSLKLDRRANPAVAAARPSLHVNGKKGRTGSPGQPNVAGILKRREAFREGSPIPEELEEGVDVTHLLGLLQLNEHTCKWPHGDPLSPNFGFCGERKEPGRPYCEAHLSRAYQRGAD